jgi:Family of unknown function (DUF5906)
MLGNNVEPRMTVRHAVYGVGRVLAVLNDRAGVEFITADDAGRNSAIVDVADLTVEDVRSAVESPTLDVVVSAPPPVDAPAEQKYALEDDPEYDHLSVPEESASVDSIRSSSVPPLEIISVPEASEGAIPEITEGGNATPQAKTILRKFNKDFYVVSNFGGACVVCEEDASLNLKHQSFQNFTNRFLHWQSQIGFKEVGRGANKTVVPVHENAATYWLKHPNRRQYDRVTFAPGEDLGPKVRNLWRGFTVAPIKGDCSLYLNDLRDNICKGDNEKYQWLINWMAWKVQHPGTKCYISIVLRGGEGVGKNICYDGFGDLFGPHSITVTNKEHVAGHFNAHLRACCVLCANEAFFAGDRQHEATLKSLISDDFFMIEAKGYDPIPERNRLGLFIISNESWVVPASSGARRFTVLDCGDEHAQDTKYFRALVHQLDNGGREALLHHLLKEVDVSKFDERKPLITDALSDQQAQSTRGIENLWFECLVRGTLPFADASRNFIRAEHFLTWARAQGRREWKDLSAEKLGYLLSNNPRGVHKGMNFTKTKLNNRSGWVISNLRECREMWNRLRFKYDWNDPDAEWESTV